MFGTVMDLFGVRKAQGFEFLELLPEKLTTVVRKITLVRM
jgi:hypothetical protein